jgi:catechol 2,3-dioxygenase-like lactoylglutathione lyase family enzyme
MSIRSLDHVNIVTPDLDETVRFYERFIGLRNGERPNFTFPGAWLYCGDVPIIHLIGREPDAPGTGVVDHFALGATDIKGFVTRARQEGFDYEVRDVPGGRIRQMFVFDPNGVKVELNFLDAADIQADLKEMAPA